MFKAVLLLQTLLVAGCVSSETMLTPPRRVTGEIMVVGNEPFTSLAVRVSKDRLYLLTCDRRIREFLLAKQGKIAVLKYDRVRKTRFGMEIHVVNAKLYSR